MESTTNVLVFFNVSLYWLSNPLSAVVNCINTRDCIRLPPRGIERLPDHITLQSGLVKQTTENKTKSKGYCFCAWGATVQRQKLRIVENFNSPSSVAQILLRPHRLTVHPFGSRMMLVLETT